MRKAAVSLANRQKNPNVPILIASFYCCRVRRRTTFRSRIALSPSRHGVMLSMSLTQQLSAGSNDRRTAKKKPAIASTAAELAELVPAWTGLTCDAAPMQQAIWAQAAGETLCKPNGLRAV